MAKENFFYAITVGYKTGIFEAKWEHVMEYVEGYDFGKKKGFPTLEQAEEWWKIKSKEPAILYVIKFDPKTNEKMAVPKESMGELW